MAPLLRSVLVLSFQIALLVLVLAASRPIPPVIGGVPGSAVPLEEGTAGEWSPWDE